MKYTMTKPCEHCPFRTDCLKGWLDRAPDIAMGLVDQQGTFACHKTTEFEDGDYREADGEQHCAGAMILLEKIERPNQMMRIGERLGLYDHRKLAMDSPVFDSMEEFIAHHENKSRRRRASHAAK